MWYWVPSDSNSDPGWMMKKAPPPHVDRANQILQQIITHEDTY